MTWAAPEQACPRACGSFQTHAARPPTTVSPSRFASVSWGRPRDADAFHHQPRGVEGRPPRRVADVWRGRPVRRAAWPR
eukprot:8296549-Lingulodinium_polyedra.AAC.1